MSCYIMHLQKSTSNLEVATTQSVIKPQRKKNLIKNQTSISCNEWKAYLAS